MREQIMVDQAAIGRNTDEFAEELEFDGATLTPEGEPLKGIIGRQRFRLPGGGGWAGAAQGELTVHLMREDLAEVPEIGERVTLNGESLQVLDRSEPERGLLSFVLG